MKKSPWTTFLCLIIILQLVANVILWMLTISAREREQIEFFMTANGMYSLSFVEVGNPWPFGSNEVEVHAIKNTPEHYNNRVYFQITFLNTNDWSALSTLRFEETDNGVNFYVTQGESDGETKYIVLWDNVFPIKV